MTILISDKVNFRRKEIARPRGRHVMTIKGLIYQEERVTLDVCVSDSRATKPKLRKRKWGVNSYMVPLRASRPLCQEATLPWVESRQDTEERAVGPD